MITRGKTKLLNVYGIKYVDLLVHHVPVSFSWSLDLICKHATAPYAYTVDIQRFGLSCFESSPIPYLFFVGRYRHCGNQTIKVVEDGSEFRPTSIAIHGSSLRDYSACIGQKLYNYTRW